MGHDIRVLTEAELRAAMRLDPATVDVVERAFTALAKGGVIMPPIMSMDLEAVNGEVDVKTAFIPGFDHFALKVSTGFFGNANLGLPSLGGLMVLLSAQTGAVVAVTGAVDLITDGERVVECHNGDPMMTRVTGTGCAVSAIAGAFLAVEPDPLTAVAHALAVFGIAGEGAAESCNGPGSFQVKLLDLLFDLDRQLIADRVRLR